MKPAGAGSVMADRARGEVAGDDPRTALWRRLEFFPTPPWAARAGGELVAAMDPGAWRCWEPCCGEGHMAAGLGDYFAEVHETDVYDHAWAGEENNLDFLSPLADRAVDADWIVTNPPFALAAEIVTMALRRARRGVAVLCRLSFLESAGRWDLFHGARPLDVLAPFTDRVPMTLGRWDPQASTATAYAWFIWFQDRARPSWLEDAQAMARAATGQHHILTRAIPPGTKSRLTHQRDARDWGVRGAAPLFDPPPAENPAALGDGQVSARLAEMDGAGEIVGPGELFGEEHHG